tara:strand:+ start:36659 stop:37522 length:864 start_codon:yes stop_codon:yes gene_type:complete
MYTGEEQYLDLCKKIVEDGEWVENKRTGHKCLTVINHDITYDVANGDFPLVTTRKSFWKSAIAEMLGYLRGYSSAKEFREIGCNTWNANANKNDAWLNNPNRKGEDDMGFVYGAVARNFPKPDGGSVDLLEKVYNNLKKGVDDRGEIITFYHPGSFHLGCLRPCMFQHQFSILGDKLYLNSYQRSCDVPLGLNFNMIQVVFLLKLMAQITGLKEGKAFHKIVNAHIYENQLDLMKNVQLNRTPLNPPKFSINPAIKTLDDVLDWVTTDDFKVEGYEHYESIKYPFAV